MIDPPEITHTGTRQTAVIRLTIPRSEIRAVMGPAIHEVLAAVAAQGIGPAGPVFSRHFRVDPQVFDFEVGVPVTEPVTPTGRVRASGLPAATVARTVYRGPYEGLGPAWDEFDPWITGHAHVPGPELWEYYVSGPESSPDPTQWQTELNRPLTSETPTHPDQE